MITFQSENIILSTDIFIYLFIYLFIYSCFLLKQGSLFSFKETALPEGPAAHTKYRYTVNIIQNNMIKKCTITIE